MTPWASPILSQTPFASTDSLVISISWYLSEELPALITKTFIKIPPKSIDKIPKILYYIDRNNIFITHISKFTTN